jgi:nucleoside-diphosphate-sugar epimerase
MPSSQSVLVTGASSQIGRFLLPRLLASGLDVHALSRKPPADEDSDVHWLKADIAACEQPVGDIDLLIHLAPLPLLPPLLSSLNPKRLRQIVAFGSTSRFAKRHSEHPGERAFAQELESAEAAIAAFCELSGIAWTVFRPTLIYGCGLDKNVAVIAKFIRRFRFFPLVGEGRGLRMPVHADDLAAACLAVMNKPAAFNRAYDLSGGETLAYLDMVERIFQAEGIAPRFLRVPARLFEFAISAARLMPRYRYLTAEMARRMNRDLRFDHAEATADFGYAPREFEPPSIR